MAGDLLLSEKTGTQTYWYCYDSGANLISVTIKGKIYFYIRNAQNDIIGLVDAAGNVVVKYSYDSWGKLLSITGSLADTVGVQNPFRYRGYYYDNETGMYYLKSRYYDPEIRRFISADEMNVLSAAPMSLTDKNLYVYCDGNPIGRSDNKGNIWETIFDIVSLADSIMDVVVNPRNPLNWVGLAGDVIDLLPVVTGVGEIVRAVKVTNKVDNTAEAVKVTKRVDYYVTPIGDAIPAIRKNFDSNLAKLDNRNGKYYGEDSRGPIRIRVETHKPTPGYKGPNNPYHCNPHFHIDRRENGATGAFRKTHTGLMERLRL